MTSTTNLADTDVAVKVGEIVWWIGGTPCKPRRVRLVATTIRRDGGPGFVYQTIGGATGWQADAPASDFAPLSAYKRNGEPRALAASPTP